MIIDKQRLMQERDGLKEMNEEMKLVSVTGTIIIITTNESSFHILTFFIANELQCFDDGEAIEVMDVPPHIREKVMKLQRELKMLKSSQQQPEDVYEKLMRDANLRRSELEMELR